MLERDLRLKEIVEDRERDAVFDPSWLVDHNEKQLFETFAERVQPLVNNPGRIMLTNKFRFYFLDTLLFITILFSRVKRKLTTLRFIITTKYKEVVFPAIKQHICEPCREVFSFLHQ